MPAADSGCRGLAFVPRGARRDQGDDRALRHVAGAGVGEHVVAAEGVERGGDGAAGEVALDDPRVDVRAAGHRRRVAQVVGHLFDDPDDRPAAGGRRTSHPRRDRQADGGQHGRVPGAKVLGRVVAAGDLFEVLVDVLRAHVAPGAVVAPGEQVVTARAPPLETRHDPVDLGVRHRLHALLVAFGHVGKDDRVRRGERHVFLAHGRQAEGLVLFGVGLAAYAKEAQVEQAQGAGQHPLAREVAGRQGPVGGRADAAQMGGGRAAHVGQGGGKGQHAVELLSVAAFAPLLVVEVLAAAGGVGAGRLDMTVLVRADPDVVPGRRYGERRYAVEGGGVGDRPSAVVDVGKAVGGAPAGDAGLAGVRGAQPRHRLPPARYCLRAMASAICSLVMRVVTPAPSCRAISRSSALVWP